MLLIDYFERTARASPEHPFLHFVEEDDVADVELSYGEADTFASEWARRLLLLGIGRGTVVPLLIANSPEWLILYIACQKVGAICIGLHTALTISELEQLLQSIDARQLLYAPEFHALAQEVKDRCPSLVTRRVEPIASAQLDSTGMPSVMHSRARAAELSEDDYLSAIFTSGTTGAAPKAALQRHAAVVRAIKCYIDHLHVSASDRIMLVTPLSHSSALNWGVSLAVMSGATLVLARRFSASRFWSQAARGRPTILWTMSTILFILLAREQEPDEIEILQQMRFVFGAGSAPRWRQLVARWQCPVLDGYGMTETFGTLTDADSSGLDSQYPCIGRPVPGVDLKIVDPQTRRECAVGEVGEIVSRYGQGFAGYLCNPKAFNEAVHDGWFHTGDLACRDKEGRYFFVDRLKSVIRRGGENISSIEVEECLSSHPDVREAIVLPHPDATLGETVLALLVARTAGRSFSLEEIQAYCEGRLSKFKWPEQVQTITDDLIPRTGAGKVKKALLKGSLANVR